MKMKTAITVFVSFTLGGVCTFGYLHLRGALDTDKAYSDGYSAGAIMTSLDLLQKSLHRDVEELEKRERKDVAKP